MNIRRLNEHGIERFTDFLDSLTGDAPMPYPSALLTDPEATEEIQPAIEIEQREFGSRYAAAEYLFNRFKDSALTDIERDKGLWAWLSLFYFDAICPEVGEKRKVSAVKALYLPELSNHKRDYKHLLYGSYRIYAAHKDDPSRVMALLCVPLNRQTDIIEHLGGRRDRIRNKNLISVANSLYYDQKKGELKYGARGKGKGSPIRLAAVMDQLDVTWDLFSIAPDQLLNMLPSEFSRFKRG